MIETFTNKDDFLRTIKETCAVARVVPPIIRWIYPPVFKVGIIFAHQLDQMKGDAFCVRYDYECVSANEAEELVAQIKRENGLTI